MSLKTTKIWPFVFCAFLMGCSSESGTITSKTSKYEVGEEPASAAPSTTGDSAADASPVSDPLADAPVPEDAGPALTPPTNAVAGEQSAGQDGAPDRPSPLSTEPTTPRTGDTQVPPTSKSGSPPVSTEGGSAAEMLSTIQQLQQQRPNGATRNEVATDTRRIQTQILEAADSVLKMNATEGETLQAAEAKVGALQEMARTGAEGVEDQLFAFADELKRRDEEQVAQFGNQLAFGALLNQFSQSENSDATEVIAEFKKLFATLPDDSGQLGFGQQVAARLMQNGLEDEAVDVLKFTAAKFKDSDDEELAGGAEMLLEQVKFVKIDIVESLNAAIDGKEGANKKLSEMLNQLVTTEPVGALTFNRILEYAGQLESFDPSLANILYEAIEVGYSGHENKELREAAKQTIEKFRIRSSLVGKPFSVEGVLLDGSPFDWSKYKGKVVLVDFWATWCGPCLREMPNIRKNYEKYRDQGLEVVGVNLDEDDEQVKQFLELQQLPWPSVFSADEDAVGWEHPMAEKCGVAAIPFMVLVDRDGTAIATNVRGPDLGEKLAEMFGESPAPAEGSDSGDAAANKADTGAEEPAKNADAGGA